MDTIQIKDLQIFARHGVFAEENTLGQKFVVSAVLHTDNRKAGMTDNLDDSINYAEVCDMIEKSMTERTFRLIEAAAEYTAENILLAFPLIKSIGLTIKKPHAPILKPLDYAAVSINRGWHTAYLGIGSNMGDKKAYLDLAVERINADRLCRDMRVSEYIVTAPVGGVEQDNFLNAVIEVRTLMTPHELLDAAHRIEQAANRVRNVHWGPRTLDVDILLYDGVVIHDERLTVPHIEMHKRQFVLEPLCSLNPYIMHPVFGKSAYRLLEEITDADK